MSSGLWGADVTELRALAESLRSASDHLVATTAQVTSLVESSTRWQGDDAGHFRSEWSGTSVPLLRGVSQTLADASQALLRNADEQHGTSTEGGALPSPGVPAPGMPGTPAGPLGGPGTNGSIWNLLGVGTAGVGLLLDGLKGWKVGTALTGFLQASRLADVSDAAASASVFARNMVFADAEGILARLGTFGRAAGVVGGAFSIYGGMQQMFNTQYDGARGGVDRVMGGLSVVSGAGTIGLMLGAAPLLGPVGVGVVVGAGIVAGAWALGNVVVDNWDAISGFAANPGQYLADGWDDVTELAGNAADTIGDVASDVGDAIGDGLSAAGDFVGGLFS
ncbi:WXG100 family type VII secretion target [Cellulosimicrobium marinum]|uniref:WXG100 family type VII secretion target n=1 Tax=Cellulosimicrobium marinum TaxID=1638992 RepID=UPI001E43B0EC|nr:hypothetical protein [Cellulosimicrobium marinum]MCB7135732.1 hypothetical protein [Cellulosimicrobium marinum]